MYPVNMIRLITRNYKNVLNRFISFVWIGTLILIFELLFVGLLLYATELQYIFSIGIGFLISVTVSYFLFRKYTFSGTQRDVLPGYIYFTIIAGGGLVIVTAGSFTLVTYTDMHPLTARFILSGVSGSLNFLVNLLYNFRVAHIPYV